MQPRTPSPLRSTIRIVGVGATSKTFLNPADELVSMVAKEIVRIEKEWNLA